MDDVFSKLPRVFIRIIALVLGVNLYLTWPVANHAVSYLVQIFKGPEYYQTFWASIGFGSIGIATWLLGVITCIALFLLKPWGRWLLLIYFVVGALLVNVSWIPYTGHLTGTFVSPAGKLASIALPNLVIVIITFVCFRIMETSSPGQYKTDRE